MKSDDMEPLKLNWKKVGRVSEGYGITVDQYHAGLCKLWKALGNPRPTTDDVFTRCSDRIKKLKLDLGLSQLATSQAKGLLMSCEIALSGRDDRIEELEGQLEELTSLKDEADALCTIQDKQISELEKQLDDLASRLDGELINVRYLDELLKHAYCGVVGADSIVGLDSCDDYSNWLKSLKG